MEILCVIPARGGSKGVPEKNIRPLNGKPLIAYTIEAAKKSKYISRVVVSTDDEKIKNISLQYNAEVPYIRPKELALDNTPTIEALLHMLEFLSENENYKPEYVCLLQCTSPLRDYEEIDGAFDKLFSVKMDAVTSVCEVDCNPYWTNVFEGDKLKYFIEEGKNILRRQDLPKVYTLNGAIYIIKREALLKYKALEIDNMTGYIMDKEKSIDIDNMIDFQLAEILIKERG